MKKWLITLIAFTFIFPFMSDVKAQDDITGHQYEKEMRTLNSLEIMKGNGQGLFYPNELVTRAEFAAFMARALKLPAGSSDFSDVGKNAWYYDPISKVYQEGLIQGIGGNKFGPNLPITREQMATLVDRAVERKGIKLDLEGIVFPFSDIEENRYSKVHVQRLHILNIMTGVNENSFNPTKKVNRAETAHTIYRMLDVFLRYDHGLDVQPKKPSPKDDSSSDEETPQEPSQQPEAPTDSNQTPEDTVGSYISTEVKEQLNNIYDQVDSGYTIVSVDSKGEFTVENTYTSLHEAKNKIANLQNQFIVNNDKIVWTGKGIALSKGLVVLYKEDMKTSLTYVASNTELKFIDSEPNKVKVQISDTVGYVNPQEVQLIPDAFSPNRSYYEVKQGNLIHSIFQSGRYHSYTYGPAPMFMREGERDVSWNGRTFKKGTAYHYFNYLPLHTKTSYTAEQLDDYIRSQAKDSPLIGLGATFKKAEEEVGVNALYLLGHAIHESAWGFSKIAQDKYNLFGIRATDDNPYGNATGFNSFEDSIMYAAHYVKGKYLSPGPRTFYNGAFLGNKSYGMNVYYASDPYWGQKISGHMFRADEFLGNKDWNKYQLAVSKVNSLNVRGEPVIGRSLLYEYQKPDMSMVVLDLIRENNATWYKILSDDPNHTFAYVYGNGELGTFVEPINW